jgi:hypothetical protein
MGDVKGMMENQKATGPSGFIMAFIITMIERIRGIVIGSINCCVSVSLSAAEPTAAKRDAYRRYPPRK